jgi:hypothetical protein
MSFGGKEDLLKAVIQAIPTSAMSVFKLPKQIIKRIISAISQFWWGDDDQQKHMHWFAWWKMCVSTFEETGRHEIPRSTLFQSSSPSQAVLETHC